MALVTVGLAALGLATSASAATYTVTNTDDSGAGSLRQAILDSNASSGTFDTIEFDIPGPGVHTIAPATQLHFISDPVAIDGTTQPGYSGTPLIEVDGEHAGDVSGFEIDAAATTIKGLAINRFGGRGIFELGTGGTFEADYIGTTPDGRSCAGNGYIGLHIATGSGHTVGGTNADARNVIACNGGAGIDLSGTGTVKNNYLGLLADGTAGSGQPTGIIVDSPNVTIGGGGATGRNWIGGNTQDGVLIRDIGPTGNDKVSDAFIGTDPTGTEARPNGRDGIRAAGVATTITHDVIAGNGRDGVYLHDRASGASIMGNTIGRGIGTDSTSIGIESGATGYTGPTLPNGRDGIEFDPAADATGTTGSSVGYNVIADNTVDGVSLDAPTGSGQDAFNNLDPNPNYFSSNGGLAIDLGRDGVTANDAGDGDGGPNGHMNFPVIIGADSGGVGGTFDGAPSANVTISVFTSAHCDPSGYGEGETELGTVGPIPLPGSGDSNPGHTGFFVSTADVTPGAYLTAIATDGAGNTSEFGHCFHVPGPPRASTGGASDVQKTSATVAGSVSPDDGGATHVTVEYGPTAAHGTAVTLPDLATDDNDHAVSTALTGLHPGTTYHYEVVATNGDGTTHGGDRTFTTPSEPPVQSQPPPSGDHPSNTPGGNQPGQTKQRCKVPKLAGKKLKQARRALRRAHCRLGKVKKVKRSGRHHGLVIRSTPRAGAVKPAGAKVNLVVVR